MLHQEAILADNVNSEIFARNLFSGKVLKHIIMTLKIHDKGVIYLFSRNLAYAKFLQYKALAKISEFTVV